MRREATCECCHRNDAIAGERLCSSCRRYHENPPADTPETVAQKMAALHLMRDAMRRHLG